MSGNSAIMALDGERKRGKARGGSQLQLKLEARVNFYVEAVKGYDDTTDCSVRLVVYRSTIRQDRDFGPGTTTVLVNYLSTKK